MARRYQMGLGIAFVVVLFLPLIQQACHPFKRCALVGAEELPRPPAWGIRAVFSGEFQAQVSDWFNAHMGLRAHLVRTDNQVNYSVFGRLRASRGTKVLLGRNRYLYEAPYVEGYNKASSFSEADLRRRVERVKALQDLLAARGIAFLLVVAPSKVEIYPEHLPPGILQPGRERRETAADILGRLFVECGVNHINARPLFLEWKRSEPYPLFPPGGVHWNYYGAARITEMALTQLEQLSGKDFISLRCTGVRMETKVKGSDNDLGDLLNLWTHEFARGPHARPVLERDDRPPARGANLLLVGDSFAVTLVELLEENHVCSRVDLLYYFKRPYANPRGESPPVAYTGADLLRELEGRDAVVIEVNEFWLPEIGWGFVEQMTAALEGASGGGPKPSSP